MGAIIRRRILTLAGLAAALLASGAARAAEAPDPGARCAALAGVTVPASAFELPTGTASLREAVLMPASDALPEFCRVRGAISGAKAGDLPILFQVNLPTRWNAKTVQYGGGGLNGVVIEATGPFTGGGGAVTPALARGYVTYGGDSGHQEPGRAFYDNPQALANYAHEAVKRTHDLAMDVVRRYYGEAPRRNYHIGGSKGGQEALQAAQRYFADYDGVVSYYPAAQNQSLAIAWNRLWHVAFDPPGGALNTAEQALLKSRVLAACDTLDGAEDRVVSSTEACAAAFKVERLRCVGGADTGDDCLSDRQIAALNTAARAYRFARPMPNGITTVGPWPAFIGGDLATWFGSGKDGSQQGFYLATAVRPEALEGPISAEAWEANVLATARIYDASNPDLDGFRARGGKLLLLQGTTDMLVPTPMTTHYFQALTQRYGAAGLRGFARYYIIQGYGHGAGAFKAQWDSLDALDHWVEQGQAPLNPVVADGNTGAHRTRPLCEYPAWPKHRTGDPDLAASYVCATK